MWIFFNDAFVAISKHKDLPDHFMVRGRLRGDIEAAFPGLKLEVRERNDDGDQYRFSADVRATDVIVAVTDRLEKLGVDDPRENLPASYRDAAYGNVWFAMRAAQSREIARESWQENLGDQKFPTFFPEPERHRARPGLAVGSGRSAIRVADRPAQNEEPICQKAAIERLFAD